jgi:hypothetical protein
MKRYLTIILVFTTLATLVAEPVFKARLDIRGVDITLKPISGPERGYLKNIDYGSKEKRKFVLTGETGRLAADKWSKVSFSFMPESSGKVVISLMSNWSKSEGQVDINAHWVYYDMLSAEGSTIKNGGFESIIDGKPAYWNCDKSQLIMDLISGEYTVKAWHNKPCSQTINVKKNQKIIITFYAKACEFIKNVENKNNIVMKERNPIGADWVPFYLDWESKDTPVWDFSHYYHIPAGKHGFIRTNGPHFELGDTGKRIRLWGTNISGPACFPTHEEAIKIVVFLKRWGFNAVRLVHLSASYHNGLIDYKKNDQLTFNEDKFDRLFFFLAELKKSGIYYVIDGRHGLEFRTKDFRQFGEDYRKNWRVSPANTLLYFSSAMQKTHEEYLSKLLTTKNPYNGLKIADDPALAGFQMLNEAFIRLGFVKIKSLESLPALLRPEFQAKWELWSRQNSVKDDFDKSSVFCRYRFFSWLQREYFQRMKIYYRESIGLKCPIASTSCYVAKYGLPAAADGDYTEGHSYYNLSQNEAVVIQDMVGKGSKKVKMARLPLGSSYVKENFQRWLPFSLQQRIGYQPFVLGEWNTSHPHPERFAAPLWMVTLGNIQDFDGMFMFTLAQSPWNKVHLRDLDYLVSIGDPSRILNMIPAAFAWHGNMIPAAKTEIAVTVPDNAIFGTEEYNYKFFAENELLFRTYNCPEVPGMRMPPKNVLRLKYSQSTQEAIPELKKEAQAQSPITIKNNRVLVKTAKFVSAWGQLGGSKIYIAPLVITSKAKQEFSVSALSLDDISLAESKKVLITIGPVSLAKGVMFTEKFNKKTDELLGRWSSRKSSNPMVKPIYAEIDFLVGKGWSCYGVSPVGVKEELIVQNEGVGISWRLESKNPHYFFLLER